MTNRFNDWEEQVVTVSGVNWEERLLITKDPKGDTAVSNLEELLDYGLTEDEAVDFLIDNATENAFATAKSRRWYFANRDALARTTPRGGGYSTTRTPIKTYSVDSADPARIEDTVQVTDEKPLGNGRNVNQVFTAKDPEGNTVVYKPAAGEADTFAHIFPQGSGATREIAAHVVDKELGLGNVPKTVRGSGEHGPGSIRKFVDDAHESTSPEGKKLLEEKTTEVQIAELTAFDVITGNLDRHQGNFFVREDGTLVGFDNGASFPKNQHLQSTDGSHNSMRTSFSGRLPAKLPPHVVEKVEDFLKRRVEITRKLETLLEREEIDSMFRRAEVLLAHKDDFGPSLEAQKQVYGGLGQVVFHDLSSWLDTPVHNLAELLDYGLTEDEAVDFLIDNAFASHAQRRWYFANLADKGGKFGGGKKQLTRAVALGTAKALQDDDGSQPGDPGLAHLYREAGYNGKPKIVSQEEMDHLVEEGHLEMYRGHTDPAFADDYREGPEQYPGLGIFGNGTYVAFVKEDGIGGREGGLRKAQDEALDYAGSDGEVMRMALAKDAKVVKSMDLMNQFNEETTLVYGGATEEFNDAWLQAMYDPGRFAVYKGYDAIDVSDTSGQPYMVVLNRGKTIVQRKNPLPTENELEDLDVQPQLSRDLAKLVNSKEFAQLELAQQAAFRSRAMGFSSLAEARQWLDDASTVNNAEGGWKTIRGAKVFIGKGGKIEKGPKGFVGKNVSELGEGKSKDLQASAQLESRFDGARYDAPEEGIVSIYRVTLSDGPVKVADTSLMVGGATGIGRVSDTSVVPEFRKMGYASKMYRELLTVARDLGVKELWSDTSQNPKITHIWKSLGATLHPAPEGDVYRIVLTDDASTVNNAEGGWRTIRGAKVFIGKGGKIEKGPKNLVGKGLSELGKGKSKVAEESTTAPPPGKFYTADVTKDSNKDGVADQARVGVPAHQVPPPPPIPRLPNLTKEERKAEGEFIKAYESDPDGVADRYLNEIAKAGNPPKFETDAAKQLSSAWVDNDPTIQAQKRSHFNTALHQTANAITKRAFQKYLDTLQPGDEILVTNGGCGAGKGYALKNVSEALEIAKRSKAIWDSAGDQNATENTWLLEEAQARGLKLNFIHVHADPKTQWAHPERGVVARASDPADGRMVDAAVFADSYAHGAKNMKAFHEAQKDNEAVSFTFLDNTGKPKLRESFPEEALVDRDELYRFAHQTIAEGNAPPHIKRGATVGERIWGGA